MPHTVPFSSAKVILSPDISTLVEFLRNALVESGLVSQNASKEKKVESKEEDAKEFLGENKRERQGLLNTIFVKIEDWTDANLSAYETELPKESYELDPPAFELQQRYENYLNEIFQGKVNSKNTNKKHDDKINRAIDDKFVYVNEILLRLFTAAISVNKNATSEVAQAAKLVNCLQIFCKKINDSVVLFEKETPFFGQKRISQVNDAFSQKHLEWIFFLQNMQKAIGLIHSHTATLTAALNTFEQLKKGILLHLIICISSKDVSNEDLSAHRLKITLANTERDVLQTKEGKQSLVKMLGEYNEDEITSYQKSVVAAFEKKNLKKDAAKINSLYELLAKTNILLHLLQQFDMLFTTTGWVLIVSNVIDFEEISRVLDEHKENYRKEIVQENFRLDDKLGMQIARTSFLTSYGTLFMEKTFDQITHGLSTISNPMIKEGVIKTIGLSLSNLKKHEFKLKSKFIDENKLQALESSVPHRKLIPSGTVATSSSLLASDSPLQNLKKNSANSSMAVPREKIGGARYAERGLIVSQPASAVMSPPPVGGDSHIASHSSSDATTTNRFTTGLPGYSAGHTMFSQGSSSSVVSPKADELTLPSGEQNNLRSASSPDDISKAYNYYKQKSYDDAFNHYVICFEDLDIVSQARFHYCRLMIGLNRIGEEQVYHSVVTDLQDLIQESEDKIYFEPYFILASIYFMRSYFHDALAICKKLQEIDHEKCIENKEYKNLSDEILKNIDNINNISRVRSFNCVSMKLS